MANYKQEYLEQHDPSAMGGFAELGAYMGSSWARGIEGKMAGTPGFKLAQKITNKLGAGSFRGFRFAAKHKVANAFGKIALSRFGAAAFTLLNAYMFVPYIFQGTKGAITTLRRIGREGPRQEFGKRFYESGGTYTERQRAVRAITSSRMSVRSALGNEAMLMHR
jgi:hypothetical protein